MKCRRGDTMDSGGYGGSIALPGCETKEDDPLCEEKEKVELPFLFWNPLPIDPPPQPDAIASVEEICLWVSYDSVLS